MMGIIEMILTSLVVTVIMALVMAAMGLGVLLGRNPLQCGCRRLAEGEAGTIGCEDCPYRSSTVAARPAEASGHAGPAASD